MPDGYTPTASPWRGSGIGGGGGTTPMKGGGIPFGFSFSNHQDRPPPFSPPAPKGINEPFSRSSRSTYTSSMRSRRAFEASGAPGSSGAPQPMPALHTREAWMIGATDREIATVATGSGTDRISKAAVVESLREATKSLEPQMAASVQSAALSQLQADVQGNCTREEVARVWLTNVLPALERAPLRTATGGLGTRTLTERLQRMTHGRLSQVMLDELPAAQDALGLALDPTGGGALPKDLVQPLVATLTAAALRATVHELGDALLSLPGLEGLAAVSADDLEGPLGREGGDEYEADLDELTGSVSQADAVGAAEGLVRRMLEGALHGHHFALALAMSGDDDDAVGGGTDGRHFGTSSAFGASDRSFGTGSAAGGGGGGVDGVDGDGAMPTAKDMLKLREVQAAVLRLSEENGTLVNEHNALLDEHTDLKGERNALISANRHLEAEHEAAREAERAASDRASELSTELHRSYAARDAIEADLAELRSSVQSQVVTAVEASQAAAKASYDSDMRHDRLSLEREVATLRASRDAEVAANAEVQRRCDRLSAEKHALEVERAALLAERAANDTRAAAMQATLESLSPVSPRRSAAGAAATASPHSLRRSPLAAMALEEPARSGGDDGFEDDGFPGPTYTSALRDEVRL